jgi:hypothetical protein
LTSILQFFAPGAQSSVGLAICTVYLWIILLLHPYIRRIDDRLASFIQVQLYCILLMGSTLQNVQFVRNSKEDTLGSVVLLFVLFALIIILLYNGAVFARNFFRNWQRARNIRKTVTMHEDNPLAKPDHGITMHDNSMMTGTQSIGSTDSNDHHFDTGDHDDHVQAHVIETGKAGEDGAHHQNMSRYRLPPAMRHAIAVQHGGSSASEQFHYSTTHALSQSIHEDSRGEGVSRAGSVTHGHARTDTAMSINGFSVTDHGSAPILASIPSVPPNAATPAPAAAIDAQSLPPPPPPPRDSVLSLRRQSLPPPPPLTPTQLASMTSNADIRSLPPPPPMSPIARASITPPPPPPLSPLSPLSQGSASAPRAGTVSLFTFASGRPSSLSSAASPTAGTSISTPTSTTAPVKRASISTPTGAAVPSMPPPDGARLSPTAAATATATATATTTAAALATAPAATTMITDASEAVSPTFRRTMSMFAPVPVATLSPTTNSGKVSMFAPLSTPAPTDPPTSQGSTVPMFAPSAVPTAQTMQTGKVSMFAPVSASRARTMSAQTPTVDVSVVVESNLGHPSLFNAATAFPVSNVASSSTPASSTQPSVYK